MGERVDVDGEEGDGRLFERSIREIPGEPTFASPSVVKSTLFRYPNSNPTGPKVVGAVGAAGVVDIHCDGESVLLDEDSCLGDSWGGGTGDGSCFPEGRDRETKDPSEGWASG